MRSATSRVEREADMAADDASRERELAAALHETDIRPHLDPDVVIARARGRRRRRSALVGAAGALATIGIVGIGVQTLMPFEQEGPAVFEAQSESAPDLSPLSIGLCTVPTVQSPTDAPVALTVEGGDDVRLRLLNTGEQTVSVAITAAEVVDAAGEVAVRRGTGTAVETELAPGSSLALDVALEETGCAADAVVPEPVATVELTIDGVPTVLGTPAP